MKILYFNDFRLGILKGELVVDVTDVVADIPHTGPHNLISGLIERFDQYKTKIEAAVKADTGVPLRSVRIRPPLPKPNNIDCMAVNYMEDGTRTSPAPINAFNKAPGTVIGDGDTMVLPDVAATVFEGEAEVARHLRRLDFLEVELRALAAQGDGGHAADAKKLYGWKSDRMVERYGAAAAEALAIEHGLVAAGRMELA